MTKHLLIATTALAVIFGTADLTFAKGDHGGDQSGHKATEAREANRVFGGGSGSEGPPEGHSLYCESVLKTPHAYAPSAVHACQLPGVTG